MASVLLDRQRRMRGFPPQRAIAILLALAVQLSLPLFAQDRLLPVYYFRQVEGLSTDEIRSNVVRDREGFVWVGTLNGLDRYDGYNVKEYRHDLNDPHSLSSAGVTALLVDRKGRLWAATYFAGLNLYDRSRDRFITFVSRPGDSSRDESKGIHSLSEDRSGNLWMGCNYGGIVRVEIPPGENDDLDSLGKGIHFTTYLPGTSRNSAACMIEHEDGTILVGSDSGLVILDPTTHAISRLQMPDLIGRRLDSVWITCLKQDSHGNLWIGTWREGLFRLDREMRTVANFRHREGDEHSLKGGSIIDILEDPHGNLWIGSQGGVDLFSPSTGKCLPYLTIGSMPHWPVDGMRMSLDSSGVLWIGTFDGGLHWLSPKSRRFPLYGLRDDGGSSPISFWRVDRDSSGDYWFMSSTGVLYQIDIGTKEVTKRIDVLRGKQPSFVQRSSFIDKRGFYWYGVFGLGLYRVDLSNGEVRNYSAASGLIGNINGIAQAEGDTLWIAGYQGGLMKFAITSERFISVEGLPAGDVWSVMKDRNGRIWLGSELNGLTLLDPKTGAIERLRPNPSDPRSLSGNTVRFTYEDPSGRDWIGSGRVVHLWDPATRSFTRYVNSAFPRSQFVDRLGSDIKGQLWVSFLYGGIAVLDPSSGIFTNFDLTDGIGAWVPMQTLPDGRAIVLHDYGGVNIFHPDSIETHRSPPPLVITGMAVNDQRVVPPRSSGSSNPLQLSYTQNVLEFEFAAIDIDSPELVEYLYMLEGLEKEWVRPKDRRFVRYPSLAPGDYVFRVKAASSRGEWPDQEMALAITIAPPWWRAPWAYVAYGLILAALLFAAYRLRIRQIQLKQTAETEHFQAEHLAEVDRLKSRFFSNISHEFRTPLTLILGPAQQGIEASTDKASRQRFHLIRDNARKLHALVTQVLDFSRLESGMMRLQVSGGEIVQFLRRVVMSFESWAERKKINLEFCSEVESADGFFDRDKLEKIVNNLVSNAVKFTPEGGRVTVTVTEFRIQNSEFRSQYSVRIAISDTGPGIAPEHLLHIFDRFYRVDETHTTEGTGIGLALTRELVELHHGTITVESSPGKGSIFTVALPIGREAFKAEEITETVAEPEEERSIEVGPPVEHKAVPAVPTADGKPIVLVVEDNADLRVYIREYLETDYAVKEAENGKLGFDRAVETIPDLVISDVMMPEMDGMELCRSLKQDVRTSHVPVILLTARAGTDSKIEGLEIGADDYVTKPFDAKELLARVRNLIEQRRQLRARFSAGVVLRPGEVAVTSLDDALLKKVMEAVEKNIGNEDFGVDDLAREACLSRTHLNNKLHALTNLAPGEFIRYVRLQRAHELLEKNGGTIAEIAYQVGFGSPSYFGACFRERFGYPPSEVPHKHLP